MSRFSQDSEQAGKQTGDANPCGSCFAFDHPTRRELLAAAPIAFGLSLVLPGAAIAQGTNGGENERAKVGDLFVPIEGGGHSPIEPRDVPIGGPPLFVWPMEPANGIVRNGSRLNKVLLLR